MRTLSTVFLLGISTALSATSLTAQQETCTVGEAIPPLVRLSLLSQKGCLGGSNDVDALTKSAMKSLPAALSDTASKKEVELVVLSALDPVLKAVERERDRAAEGSAQRAMLARLAGSVALVRTAVTSGLTLTNASTDASAGDIALLQPLTWAWDAGSEGFGESLPLPLAASVKGACATTATETCAAAERSGAFVLRAATLVKRSLDYYNRPLLATALATTSRRDARWTAYFERTLVQFPWELALNSHLFSRAARAEKGFALPPSSQWVLLHPMAGVEYVWSAAQGNRMTPALAMEVLGYNRWSWNAANAPARALGASVVAAFSDRSGVQNVGVGVLVRYAHKYSVAVTTRGGKAGVMMSSEFGTWLSGTQDQARQAMRLRLP